jgi:hypothetical protein
MLLVLWYAFLGALQCSGFMKSLLEWQFVGSLSSLVTALQYIR